MKSKLLLLLLLPIFTFAKVLPVSEAFKIDTKVKNQTIISHIDLGDTIYIYDDKLEIAITNPKRIDLRPLITLPKPIKHDKYMVFDKDLTLHIPLTLIHKKIGKKPFDLTLSFQGCSTQGLCYPPIKKVLHFSKEGKLLKEAKNDSPKKSGFGSFNKANLIKLDEISPDKTEAKEKTQKEEPISTIVSTSTHMSSTNQNPKEQESSSDEGRILKLLKSGSYLTILTTFFLLGLGLAFTPCIFPMIPILSSIITLEGKQSGGMSTKRGLFLSAVYIVSSALIYAVAGIASASFGSNILSAMQNPWVIVTFAAIFVALAFSMFGYYEIQLPKSLQNFANRKSDESKGNGVIGVAIMGALSALIVGPCVAPPLAAALIFIGQTGDILLGGLALFLLGLGMGAPLLLIGIGGGKFMPKPGGWMTKVSYFFGIVMLGIAISFLSRIIPNFATLLLWSALFIGSGIYAGAFHIIKDDIKAYELVKKMIAILLVGYGLILLVGAFSGGESVLNPLKYLYTKKGEAVHKADFKIVKSNQELNKAINEAKKPLLIDFSAEWCAACKELEENTFSNKEVIDLMKNFELIRVDVTKNSDEDKAMQKRYGIVGPPAIIFYDRDKRELKSKKVIGYKDPKAFMPILKSILGE